MNKLNNYLLKLHVWRDEQGQDLVEYALAAGMVAVAAVAAMPALSSTVNTVFSKIGSIITANIT
jgi:pilus assembly protein Flp/PilA